MRRSLFCYLVVFLSITAWSLPVLAQNQPLPCRSYQGYPVRYIADPQLNNVGVATTDGYGNPVIIMNPNVVNSFPPLARQFWFAHECAHHAMAPNMNNETNADCFAVRNLRSIGMMRSRRDIDDMLDSISRLPGNIMTGHLPGYARAANMYACLSQ